jgi:hypothetical protein
MTKDKVLKMIAALEYRKDYINSLYKSNPARHKLALSALDAVQQRIDSLKFQWGILLEGK